MVDAICPGNSYILYTDGYICYICDMLRNSSQVVVVEEPYEEKDCTSR